MLPRSSADDHHALEAFIADHDANCMIAYQRGQGWSVNLSWAENPDTPWIINGQAIGKGASLLDAIQDAVPSDGT